MNHRSGWFLLLSYSVLFGLVVNAATAAEIFWPTPDSRFFEGESVDVMLQPTASGRLESALFGCVRNGGRRFHEGLDLKPLRRDRSGEASDPIYSVMAGRVSYVNAKAGNSSYGRYVVVEHLDADVPVYTLYAHLASIEPGIRAGSRVEAGQRLGTMGRSAGGYSIPRSRAHLHFEIGLVKTSDFDDWYRQQSYGSRNLHGNYNGINMIGSNPLTFFETVRAGEFEDFSSYFANLPTAFTVRVATRTLPDFILRYPKLLTRPIPRDGVAGWDIDYTWYGLPKRWTPLTEEDVRTRREGDVTLVSWDESVFEGQCRATLVFDSKGNPSIGKNLKSDLKLMFGF
ncbi:M23 family metallopeptidase [Rubellicoccus peritrichatus]|uniref:M23 family metallopeptidase n=1 Tax=Rubellicoccus peritrichatus TaxID=3080537 RepID=A0AAQ3QXV5_9BACT|nr:M23 family metallopeptidase [Puniceicoccus sp. CR14]WOO43215.1 M23 family metallopeptidase [Puniceicoccus sp. CR14]